MGAAGYSAPKLAGHDPTGPGTGQGSLNARIDEGDRSLDGRGHSELKLHMRPGAQRGFGRRDWRTRDTTGPDVLARR